MGTRSEMKVKRMGRKRLYSRRKGKGSLEIYEQRPHEQNSRVELG
jgi:hypothetical protein